MSISRWAVSIALIAGASVGFLGSSNFARAEEPVVPVAARTLSSPSLWLTPGTRAPEVAVYEDVYAAISVPWKAECNALVKALDRLADDARANYVAADCEFRQSKIKESTQHLRDAIAADPRSPYAWAAMQMLADLLEAKTPRTALGLGAATCEEPAVPSKAVMKPEFQTMTPIFYPSIARYKWAEGRVLIDACIGPEGRILGAIVTESSGRLDLDALSLMTLWESTFRPATVDGRPVTLLVRIPLDCKLK